MSEGNTVNFKPLYRIAHISAFTMLLIIPLQIVIFIISPPPDTIEGFFSLYQQSPLLGLLSLDLLYLINNLILIIIYIALFILLYREKPVTVLLALILGIIGVACYYPSNPAFEMLTLSNQYAQAIPDQKTIYLAAGNAIMAGYTGTTFNVYYILSAICLFLFSVALINSRKFKKSVGLWGLTSGFLMIVPSSAGVVGMVFSLLSLIPWMVFVALLMIYFNKFSNLT